jgi:hypothetical protein
MHRSGQRWARGAGTNLGGYPPVSGGAGDPRGLPVISAEKSTIRPVLGTEFGQENVQIDDFGCHLWLGAVNGRGYGPHVTVWEAWSGRSLPPGVVLDHICRRRTCVNPDHLDPVTQGENERRKAARYRAKLLRCPVGHRLVDPMLTPEGGIACRACKETQHGA